MVEMRYVLRTPIFRTEKQVINMSVIFTHRFCELVHFNGLLWIYGHIHTYVYHAWALGISLLFARCKQIFHLSLANQQ